MPARFEEPQPIPPQLSAFTQMETDIAASQGGRISVGQIIAIARITSSQPGAPTFQELADKVAAMQGGRISLREMLALRDAISQPAAGYGPRSSYVQPSTQESSATLQSYYGSSAPAYEAPQISARAIDQSLMRQRSSSAYSSAEATSPNSAILQSPSSRGLIDTVSGQYMALGAGGYTDPRNGTFYAQSGPNGVVNTRTGEFIPTH